MLRLIEFRFFSLKKPAFSLFAGAFFIILWMLYSPCAKSQEIKILKIDSSLYPKVRLTLSYKSKTKLDYLKDLNFSQGNKKLEYIISENAAETNTQVKKIFFLVEASGYVKGKTLKKIKDGLVSSLTELDKSDLINMAWFTFSDSNQFNSMKLLSNNYYNDRRKFEEDLMSTVSSVNDSLNRVDLFRSVMSSLKYIEGIGDSSSNKILIVISTGKEKKQPEIGSSDCVEMAKKLEIPVYAITVRPTDSSFTSGNMMERICVRTGGKQVRYNDFSSGDIKRELIKIFNYPPLEKVEEKIYDIILTLNETSDYERAMIDMDFRGKKQLIQVSKIKTEIQGSSDYKLYLWVSIGILGLILIIMTFAGKFTGKIAMKVPQGDDNDEQETQSQELLVEQGKQKKNKEIKIKPTQKSVPGQPVILARLNGRTIAFPISKTPTSIGRHEGNDIVLSGEQTVTGKHAIITISGKEITITDLGSTMGTFVNDERIKSKVIVHGDKIRLGNTELTLKE